MSKFIDLTGQRFNRLTVVERAENKGGSVRWLCRCDCGNEKVVTTSALKNGLTKSCGCLHRELNTKHNLRYTKIYRIWINIKQRCFNSNRQDYERYGGRGITICDEWYNSFSAFYDYVSKLPHYNEEGYSLDRINNNGNYEPGNVRWTDIKTQNCNKRDNILIDFYGHPIPLIRLSELTGINYLTLHNRYRRGDRGEKLLRPVRKIAPKSELVFVENNQVYTTSLIVAEKFDKEHRNVLRDIRKLIDDLKQIGVCSNLSNPPDAGTSTDIPIFIESTYRNKQNNQTYPMFLMNRNALTLLVMNFDGLKALEWKLKYIAAFNRMEQALK